MTQLTSNVTTRAPKYVNIDFDKNTVYISGITAMIESDDKQILANMGDTNLTLCGEKLEIISLDTAGNLCTVSGRVNSLKYSKGAKKQSLIKRIFK